MTAMTDTSVPGLDLERLGAWLAANVAGAGRDLSARLIAGGKSNLTYEVTDGTASWIVRRPPLGHVLATAHDMAREYRVMSALQGTDVPVPTTFALCQDLDVLGAPFYVMERVEGHVYRKATDLVPLGAERTRVISKGLIDALASLHAVDPTTIGLGDFGRPEGFLARQVDRWKKQLDASHSRDLPAADELYECLVRDVPDQSTTGIVHGDFRLDNVLTDDNDRPAGIIDWEMATIGDPLTDLALMLVYGRLANVAPEQIMDAPRAPGYLTEDEIVGRYESVTRRDLSRFGFYLALASFKLAGIVEGIHYRYLNGQTVGDGFATVGDSIHPLLEGGLAALKEDR